MEIEGHCSADEIFQGRLIDSFTFMDIDGASDISLEAGVEKTCGVFQCSTLGEGQLDGALICLARADDAAMRKDGSPPFPFFDDFRVCLVDDSAHFRKHLAAPVPKFFDSLVD